MTDITDPQQLINQALSSEPAPTVGSMPKELTEQPRPVAESTTTPTPKTTEEVPLAFATAPTPSPVSPNPALTAPQSGGQAVMPVGIKPVEPVKPKKKSKVFGIIAGLILLIGAVVGGGYYYYTTSSFTPTILSIENGGCKTKGDKKSCNGSCVQNGAYDGAEACKWVNNECKNAGRACSGNTTDGCGGLKINEPIPEKAGCTTMCEIGYYTYCPSSVKTFYISNHSTVGCQTVALAMGCTIGGDNGSGLGDNYACTGCAGKTTPGCRNDNVTSGVGGLGKSYYNPTRDKIVCKDYCGAIQCDAQDGSNRYRDAVCLCDDTTTTTPELSCSSLTKNIAVPMIGDELSLTCAGSVVPAGATTLTYSFRYRRDLGDWYELAATGDKAMMTVALAGDYEVQCKACGTIDGASVCDPAWTGATQ